MTEAGQRRYQAIMEQRRALGIPLPGDPTPPRVCPYRGEVVRLVACAPCGGRVKLKVYACSQHGECVMRTPVDGIHRCELC